MRIYLDSVATIYLVEKVAPFYEVILESVSVPRAKIFISEMNRLECRVKPMKVGDQDLLQDYETFFQSQAFKIIGLSRKVIDQATRLRATYNFKTPDAIHLAAAISGRCERFITNDKDLRRCPEIIVELISDFVAPHASN